MFKHFTIFSPFHKFTKNSLSSSWPTFSACDASCLTAHTSRREITPYLHASRATFWVHSSGMGILALSLESSPHGITVTHTQSNFFYYTLIFFYMNFGINRINIIFHKLWDPFCLRCWARNETLRCRKVKILLSFTLEIFLSLTRLVPTCSLFLSLVTFCSVLLQFYMGLTSPIAHSTHIKAEVCEEKWNVWMKNICAKYFSTQIKNLNHAEFIEKIRVIWIIVADLNWF